MQSEQMLSMSPTHKRGRALLYLFFILLIILGVLFVIKNSKEGKNIFDFNQSQNTSTLPIEDEDELFQPKRSEEVSEEVLNQQIQDFAESSEKSASNKTQPLTEEQMLEGIQGMMGQ